MANVILITGTDTGIGKTLSTALLCLALRRCGIIPGVIKPVETGCAADVNGELLPADGMLLRNASGGEQAIDDIVLYRFRSPVAGPVAAAAENVEMDRRHILDKIANAARRYPLVLVEGAGGLLSPLLPDYTLADLGQELESELGVDGKVNFIAVVGSRLGALNHAALTFETLKHRGVKLFGYIFNELTVSNVNSESRHVHKIVTAQETNRGVLREIGSRYGVDEVAYLPYLASHNFAGLNSQQDATDHCMRLALTIIEQFKLSG